MQIDDKGTKKTRCSTCMLVYRRISFCNLSLKVKLPSVREKTAFCNYDVKNPEWLSVCFYVFSAGGLNFEGLCRGSSFRT